MIYCDDMEPQNNTQNKYQPYFIPGAIVIAGILITLGIIFSGQIKVPSGTIVGNDQSANAIKKIVVEPVTSKDHILGNPNAEVFIVEYSDTECPFCKMFHNTLHKIMNEYNKNGSGKVAWVYRHFPIPQLHPKAPKEAEATECAQELGGSNVFWKYLDQVYSRTESNNKLDLAELPKIAQAVGIDVTKFNTCLSSGKYANFIEESRQAAQRAGGQGTPYSVLVTKDQKIPINEGAIEYSDLKARIDALLK